VRVEENYENIQSTQPVSRMRFEPTFPEYEGVLKLVQEFGFLPYRFQFIIHYQSCSYASSPCRLTY
jgi:hypothetical protein